MFRTELDEKSAEAAIGYSFKDRKLLRRAFTHSTRAYEDSGSTAGCNERLEFLGDAVLEQEMSVFLYNRLPDKREGDLTRLRSQIVCASSLAKAAKKIGLERFMLLGRGASAERRNDATIADCTEAVIGAVFLDGGQAQAHDFINRILLEQAEEIIRRGHLNDPKTLLQEYFQGRGQRSPEYRIVAESGPAHAKKFKAAVYEKDEELGCGEGTSKQSAEAAAAADALNKLKVQ